MFTALFYSKILNDFVVDSLCECGHLESQHGSFLQDIGEEKKIRVNSGGSCCFDKCFCEKFIWMRWVCLEEYLQKYIRTNDSIHII